MSLRSSHTASAPGPCRGQCVVDLMSRRHPDKMHIVKTLKHDHNLQDFDLFSSRRTLYPPWRILLYPTFQERMLMMVLGLLLAAKEKLIGICATLNKHTGCQMHLWTCTKMPHSGLCDASVVKPSWSVILSCSNTGKCQTFVLLFDNL